MVCNAAVYATHMCGRACLTSDLVVWLPCLQVSFKQRTVHPVYATILNWPYSQRIRCIDTVAYLPVLTARHRPVGMSLATYSRFKLAVFHAAWAVLLQPLKAVAEHGTHATDVCGCLRRVVPVVCSIVGDNVELSMMAATYLGHNSMRKCQRCLRPTADMGKWHEEPPWCVEQLQLYKRCVQSL